MNYQMIRFVLGRILLTEAALLALPLAVAVLYHEPIAPYLIPALLLTALWVAAGRNKPKRTVTYAKEGFVIVSLAWIMMSFFGALPFVISGDIPFFVDAFFETVSGFTTTGATLLTEVESLSHGGLFWRSLTHWVGGMGVLVFVIAILPMDDGHGMHMMRAEVPGPTVGKLVSRMSDTAKILYGIYFGMTVILIVLLAAGGMSLFDACIHAFGTAGTGGFSSRNLSIGAYNNAYFDVLIGVFMLLFGINFNLYYFLLIKRFRDAFRSEELKVYLLIVAAAVAAITANIAHIYDSVWTGLRHAFFQVSAIITTTGYATADFNTWPGFAKTILVLLMFVGGCAGSTAGGMKVARMMIFAKASFHDMRKMLHPNAVSIVRLEGKVLPEREVRSVHLYLTMYMFVLAGSLLLLSLDGFDMVTTTTAVITCINNVGPGLELVGPTGNFSHFSYAAKLLLAFDMLVGRLEIFPILLLFSPSVWLKSAVRRKKK